MYIRELTFDEFNNFTDEFMYSSIYQTTEYGLIMSNQKYDSIFLGLVDEFNKIYAASLILIENDKLFKYAYAPKGFLIDYNELTLVEEFTTKIKEYLGKKKIAAIKLNPMIIKGYYDYNNNTYEENNNFYNQLTFLKRLGYYHFGFNNLFESFKPRYDAIIDLDKPITTLFGNMNKNFKNKIKSADKNGVRIFKGNENEIDYLVNQVKDKYPRDKKYFEDVFKYFKRRDMLDYYYAKLDTNAYLINVQKRYQKQIETCNKLNNSLFKRIGRKNNKLNNNKIYQENLLNDIKKELVYATNLLKEKPKGIVIATMLIIKYREEVYILMDGFDKKFKKINAKHLMTWKLIEKYSFDKYKRFNLGGMINPTVKNEKYKGLNEFKLSFNSRCVEYIGDLELITNNTLYALYKNSKSIKYILKRK